MQATVNPSIQVHTQSTLSVISYSDLQVTMGGYTGSTNPSLVVAVPTPMSGQTLPIMILPNSTPPLASQQPLVTPSACYPFTTSGPCDGAIFIGWPSMAWMVRSYNGSRVNVKSDQDIREGVHLCHHVICPFFSISFSILGTTCGAYRQTRSRES